MGKKNLLFAIILFSTFATASILALLAAKKITTTHPAADSTPDFFMTNATYSKFDNNGNISNQFSTREIIHFQHQNNYIFANPSLKMYSDKTSPWYITATNGKSKEGKSAIYLWDNVKLVQNSDFDITTTTLTVYPDRKFASTDKPITIVQNGSIVKAIGATADLNHGIVTLLSNVSCEYQPN